MTQHEAVAARRAVDSEALLGGARSVDIHHRGTVYRLQATRLGKLILTK
ncbi:hemin uptake protein HemP [Hydrogenophaga sp.]